MAHSAQINVNGVLTTVTEFDNPAQAIDDTVNALGAPTTPQAALSALGAGARPNLLDNAYFVGGGTGWGVFPVNQRGQVTFIGVSPMFDRWKAYYGVNFNSQLLATGWKLSGGTPWTSYVQMLRQSFIAGDPYTLTALFSDGSLVTGQVTAPSSGEFSENVYLTSSSYMRLAYNAGDSFEIIAASGDTIPTIEFLKLEHGVGQTAAYQKSDGTWAMLPQNLDYGRELLTCQQYLQLYRTQSLRPTYAADCRPVMRIDPTPGTLVIDGVTYYTNSAEL